MPDLFKPAESPIERQLTPGNIVQIDNWLDQADQFAKPYWETVNGDLTVTGLRIGSGPDRAVAKFGDTIIRHPDGTHTVRHATEGSAQYLRIQDRRLRAQYRAWGVPLRRSRRTAAGRG